MKNENIINLCSLLLLMGSWLLFEEGAVYLRNLVYQWLLFRLERTLSIKAIELLISCNYLVFMRHGLVYLYFFFKKLQFL